MLDYRQGHRTSVHDQKVLQVLHNNVVFNQIVKNRQHQPWQPLFLIKVFQLSDAQHICKASGSKRLEIRVCEIGKRCRLVPSAPGNNARRWIPRSRRVVGCKAVQTYSLPPLLLSWVGANTSNWGTTCATDPPISVVLIIQTIFDFFWSNITRAPLLCSTLPIINPVGNHDLESWSCLDVLMPWCTVVQGSGH